MSERPERREQQGVVVDLEQRRRLHAARPALRLLRRGEVTAAVIPLLRVSGVRARHRLGEGKR
jgi:hypothetical protein